MKEISCPICDCSKFNLFLKTYDKRYPKSGQEFNLVKCQGCGLVFLNPQPEESEFQEYYPEEYWLDIENWLEKWFIKFLCWTKFKKIAQYKSKGRLLDIGCGTGKFLDYLKTKGWEVYGQEISQFACAKAKSKVENIYCGPLDQCSFPDNFFDVVVLNNVLHQMLDPRRELKEIRRILKDDGALFLSIPDIQSRQFNLTKEYWFCIDSPRHIYYYSPGTINLFLKRNNFRVLEITNQFFILPLDLFHSLETKFSFKRNSFKYLVTLLPILLFSLAIKILPKWRSIMMVVAIKN